MNDAAASGERPLWSLSAEAHKGYVTARLTLWSYPGDTPNGSRAALVFKACHVIEAESFADLIKKCKEHGVK